MFNKMRMRRYVKSWTALALLLFAGAVYCFSWLYTRGAFGRSPIEIPVRLEEGRSLSVTFSVRERGEHYVELQYPKARAHDIDRELNAVAGKATLTSDGRPVARVNLPVGHPGIYSPVLFALPMEPHRDYRLSLEFAHVPPALKDVQPVIKVWMDPHYNLIFPQLELLGALLVVLTLFCLLPGIRHQAWRLRRPFLIALIASAGMFVVGWAGLILLGPSSFVGLKWSLVLASFLFIWIGPAAFLLFLFSWFVASIIAYFRSHRAQSSP
jgi:hypothetical protein